MLIDESLKCKKKIHFGFDCDQIKIRLARVLENDRISKNREKCKILESAVGG
jgi:hypothetical protein